ncbi:hypothetical protein [Gracilimonas tropica]|uniref:hypothetical protein n=1 Tax=Gracilimonas tropica TaxID=454600 RepID=UPI0003725391|nr:hypothetical protein [Gracilimonas tropica]
MKFSIRRINEWLILVMVLVLVPLAFSFLQDRWNFLQADINYLFNVHPTNVIIGLITVDAINTFSGDAVEGFSVSWRTASMFLNVVLYLMIGPYLFFKGFKRSKLDTERAKPWFWYIGGAICIASFMIVPVVITHVQVYKNTKVSAERNRVRDMMRTELAEVGFAAAEYEIIEDGINESFDVEDLDLNDLNYDYKIERVQSDTLIVISVANQEEPDLGHTMEIRPYNKSMLRIRN